MNYSYDFAVHATRPCHIRLRRKYTKKQRVIKAEKLLKSYLCMGKDSDCVRLRKCECLDVCRYGQQYIQQTENGCHLCQ